ncbi:hypothetical protein [Mycolicibacterium neoaurum]|uniref:Asp23/Gls24 family envelope stress response protein n=1 Tax=Mycolicibacterium neoaurum TaxID=1795 RepID=A0AAV2WL46_MYCNE|nr:hypothetical protein [Mycolicibacterium neoaurum]TLH57611.1 hypothetical protein C1S81_16925 [Mycolicibacterium neoaurum]CDQ44975.1 hypothetical protein BN1047_02860 [Mycolicibacterium neoaurum]
MTSEAVTQVVEPTTRGRTLIDDRVRERVIERAILATPGVVAHRTMVPGRTLPSVTIADHPAGLDVQIAAAWPVDSATVLASARSAVVRELATTLGEHPDRVEVTITRVESDRTPAQVADAYADAEVPVPAAVGSASRRFAPRRIAGATYCGVIFAVLLMALGAVAIRDALTPEDPWIAPVLSALADARWQWWTWPGAVAAALIGAVLLVIAVKPRKRTHEPIDDLVWVRRGHQRQWLDEQNFGDDGGSVR